VAQQLKPG